MHSFSCSQFLHLVLLLSVIFTSSAKLHRNFYRNSCPKLESIVRSAVEEKYRQTIVTAAAATLKLFFHDCFIQGCYASIILGSSGNNTAEKDHPDNISLAGDGSDIVIKAKAVVDDVPACKNKVSCADILAMAARDVVALAGGPQYDIELGRGDGTISSQNSVPDNLPHSRLSFEEAPSYVCLSWFLSETFDCPLGSTYARIFTLQQVLKQDIQL
ncbi:hypothetical protein K7X08_012841 [Anisodus acutangulus]|uniref:peroxidase n=1 Tax=Anisodus acutangulus TaxID=402998 RepID=A0A9Q1MDR0_9SOLA|nr:hypothetical protein K7X08_012841 [Anisodus acutangulus]